MMFRADPKQFPCSSHTLIQLSRKSTVGIPADFYFFGGAMGASSEIRVRWASENSAHSVAAENPLSRKEQEQLRSISKLLDCKPGTILYAQAEQAKFVY